MSERRTSIAVVMPFYRDDRWFPEALASVLEQQRAPDEIIVVDDASPPGSAETLRSLPPSVRVLRLSVNGGPGRARQAGTEAATADFVCYLDADDRWSPDFVAACLERLTSDVECQAVYTAIAKRSTDGSVRPFHDKPTRLDMREALVRFHAYPALAMMFRREALLDIGGWDTSRKSVEDWDLVVRFIDRYGPLSLVVGPVPEYRVGYSSRRRNAVAWDKLHRWQFTVRRNRRLLESHFGRGAHRRRFAQAVRDRADRIGGLTGWSMHLLRPIFGVPLDAAWPPPERSA